MTHPFDWEPPPRAIDDKVRKWMDKIYDTLNARFKFGEGSPEGVVTADIGAQYANLSGGGSTLWIKESGNGTNTGWTAI